MKKKIFTSLTIATILLSSGSFVSPIKADSVSNQDQSNTTQVSIPKDNGGLLENIDDVKSSPSLQVNDYYTTDEKLTGSTSGFSGAYYIIVTDMTNNTNVGEANLPQGRHNFSVKLTEKVPAGTELRVSFISHTNPTLLDQKIITVLGDSETNIPAPSVNQPVYEGDTLIYGRGSKLGNEIIVKAAGGVIIGAGTVGLDLGFEVAILPQPAYNKLYVVETNGVDTSAPTEVIVHEAHLKMK